MYFRPTFKRLFSQPVGRLHTLNQCHISNLLGQTTRKGKASNCAFVFVGRMSLPDLNPETTAAGIAVDPRTQERVVPATRRADGS
jgi:hypothetical protein